jgi:hypothetical protein
MVEKKRTWQKELHVMEVKMQSLEGALKAFKTTIEWENIAIKMIIYGQFTTRHFGFCN